MKIVFRCVTANETAEGYRLIVERTNWLNQKGIRQWSEPIPEWVIQQRQSEGDFFGYWVDNELMAVVCLLKYSITDWGDKLQGKYLYLATLASSVAHIRKGHGSSCVKAACEYAWKADYEKIYLDCIDNAGALPEFYLRLGFQKVDEQSEPDGRRDILMVNARI